MTLATAALIASGIAAGVVFGLLRRASLKLLQVPAIRWAALGLAGVGAFVYLALVPTDRADLYSGLALGALLVFTLKNVHLVGMPVVAFGLILNLAGVAINQGFSVDQRAAQQAARTGELAANRHLDDGTDPAWFLGQVVPVEPLREAVSFGDLISSFGLLNTAYRVVRKRRRPPISLTPSARAGLTTLAASTRRISD